MSKLESIIEEQEQRIQELEERIEWYQQVKYTMLPRDIDEVKMNETYNGYVNLSFPRFEMQINPLDENWYNIEWVYGLVYKHMANDSLTFLPFSRTTGSGGNFENVLKGIKSEFPFRDGLHIRVEMKLFSLRGYILFGGKIEEISLYDEYTPKHIDEMLKKMKRS